jgi:hypothetical protein
MLESLYKAYILSLEVLSNFIIYFQDNNSYIIYSLINVLVNILNCLYKCINLNVNIRAELLKEV